MCKVASVDFCRNRVAKIWHSRGMKGISLEECGRFAFVVLWALCASLFVSGCALSPTDTVKAWTRDDPTAPYIGKSKAQIIACAGEPYGRYAVGQGENLIYHYDGAGPVPGNGGLGDKVAKPSKADTKSGPLGSKQSGPKWDCIATFSFDGSGSVQGIVYATRTADSPYTENGRKKPDVAHCQFSLPNCPSG
jgi:hypothetical protein